MEQKDWLNLVSEKNQIASILRMNDQLGEFGLCLSEMDVKRLLKERKDKISWSIIIERGT